LVCATVFIGGYTWSVAEEARRLRDAVAATQLALAREQRVSAVGALAAAAAHELGSPLATIAVVAKELVHDLPPDSPHAEDALLLLSQSERCREILAQLARQPAEDGGSPYARLPISALVEASGAPYHSTRAGASNHMGLGIFIAQSLLERSGADLTFDNLVEGGAHVVISWNRPNLEALARPDAAAAAAAQ